MLLFISLSSLGLAYPNAALALVPFERNIGSASAMLGFLQIGVSGLASASIGIFDSHTMMPVTLVLVATSWIGLAILIIGKRHIPVLRFVEEKTAIHCHTEDLLRQLFHISPFEIIPTHD
ncbi:MAG: hypothetical protein WDM80_06220 [Limisphaerales bacterium]